MNDSTVSRERAFHNARFSTNGGRRPQSKYYAALTDMFDDFRAGVGHVAVPGAAVLEMGCGPGESFEGMSDILRSTRYTGLDISEAAISVARERTHGVVGAEFKVGDCHATGLPSGAFDVVFGSGILHHLRTVDAIAEVKRLLKPSGSAIFYEPLSTNPIIAMYRRFTPSDRTVDEHPFGAGDLRLLRGAFPRAQLSFYGFFTIPCALARFGPKSRVFKVASATDRVLLNSGPMWRLAWTVLAVLRN